MQPSRGWSFVRTTMGVGLSVTLAAASTAGAAPWRVDGGSVRMLVGLRPGGSFEATASSLAGELTPGAARPLALAGSLSVDLSNIDTGIGLRNQHLREKLEVARGRGYDRAVLSEIVLAEAAGEDFRGKTAFSGSLLLHGTSRPVSGKAEIRPEGPRVRVEAEFVLTLTDFGVEPPAYLGVGVTNKVVVRVSFVAVPSSGGGGR